MTDDEPEPTPRVYMSRSKGDGLGGGEVTVEVEGGADDTVDDIEDVAERRFEQAAATDAHVEADKTDEGVR